MRRRGALAAVLVLGAAGPLRTQAQQTARTWRVGLLLAGTETAVARQRAAIVERLATHGFAEGRNLRVDVRIGTFDRRMAANLAREVVASQPDAILVDTSPFALRVREATSTIPIVFTGVGDPVGTGLVKSFARPGGNATGVHFSQLEVGAKRIELVRELLPRGRRVMVARDIAGASFDTLPHLRQVATRLGFELTEVSVNWSQGFQASALWSSAYERPDAIVSEEPWKIYGVEYIADQIIRFATEQRIPSLFWEAELAERGATIAYGVDPARELGRATDQLVRVLKGAKPAELSVDQSTRYELVVNRKAAQAVGVSIPATILTRADRIID